jgi:hypothetical protein
MRLRFLLSRKRFSDGSIIRKITRESWVYTEPDGHSVELLIYFAGKGTKPENVIDPRSLMAWEEPWKEPISPSKRQDIVSKFEEYFGRGTVCIERTS